MITQKIEKYKEKYGSSWQPSVVHTNLTPSEHRATTEYYSGRSSSEVMRRSEGQFLNQNYRTACQQTKEQFAKYVEEMKAKGFAEGKFVVSQSASKPYLDAQIHRIQGLEEMHKFVDDWGTEFSGPTMIYLEYYNKNAAIFKTCPGWYKPLDTELTNGWKERLRDEGAPVDTWSSE